MAIAINNVDDIAETVVPDAPHRVLIVDDSTLMREGIRTVLSMTASCTGAFCQVLLSAGDLKSLRPLPARKRSKFAIV